MALTSRACEFDSRSWQGVLNTTWYDKVYQLPAAFWWYSEGSPNFATNSGPDNNICPLVLYQLKNLSDNYVGHL